MALETKTTEEIRDDFARLLRPLERAESLPAYYYHSDDILARETKEIFLKEWMCVGRSDEVPEPGDYFTLKLLGEPLVVCRDHNGDIQVFSTVCRHRGALIVEGRGNRRNFTCPFHGWVYTLGGELIGAPHMGNTEGFDSKQCSLPRLKTEIWEGFLFINFDTGADPLAPRLVGIQERFRNYRMSELRSAAEAMTFYNECNWKLAVEQGIDMYHVPATHPEVGHFYKIPETFGEEDPNGYWTTSITECVRPHPYITGTVSEASPFPAIEGLSNFEMSSFNLALVFPNSLIFLVPDGLATLLFFPEGPHRTQIRINLYYPESTKKMPDFRENVAPALKGTENLQYQDMSGARGAHAGMGSRFVSPGRFSYLERTTWELDKYVVNKLRAADPALDPTGS